MVDEKPNKYEPVDYLPIPTYAEATSRPSSSQSHLGPEEISNDAERQGLLRQTTCDSATTWNRRRGDYERPTVESARSSLDFLPSSGEDSPRASDGGLRREMMEMEVLDPETPEDAARRSQIGQ
ncbi:MAG: hypothetical protein M1830_003159, partial [Pleopsidium flavum]